MSLPPNAIMPRGSMGMQSDNDLIVKAHEMIHSGNRSEALGLVIQALNQNPENITALYLYGQLSPDRNSAIQAVQKVLYAQPSHTEARMLLDRLQNSPPIPYQQPGMPTQYAPPAQYMPVQPPQQQNDQYQMVQQMLVQHHLMMQQQMVNQQSLTQQQLINQQALAQQQLLSQQGRHSGASIGLVVESRNGNAFWLGLIAAFFGFFGVAHAVNAKPGIGIAYMLLGFVWDVIVVMAMIQLSPALVLILLPLHIFFAYQNAASGATVHGVAYTR